MKPPPSTSFRENVSMLHCILRRYRGPSDDSYIPSAGHVQANLQAELLRYRKGMHIKRDPLGTADRGTGWHFQVALFTRAVGIDQDRSRDSFCLHCLRSRVMVSAVVLPLSHHQ